MLCSLDKPYKLYVTVDIPPQLWAPSPSLPDTSTVP